MLKLTRLLKTFLAHFTKQKNKLRRGKMVWHAVRGTSPKVSFKNLCSNHSGGAVQNWTSVFLQEEETMGRSSCPVCCWSSNHIGAPAQWACACLAMEWRPPSGGGCSGPGGRGHRSQRMALTTASPIYHCESRLLFMNLRIPVFQGYWVKCSVSYCVSKFNRYVEHNVRYSW